jgi:ComF family protein
MADIRVWLAKRFARDAGASQTALRAVNRMGGAVAYGMLERFFAESCPACDLASRGGFCGVCAAELTRVVDACPRCGLARPVAQCPRTQIAWEVDALVAPFSYEPPLDNYVQALKYRGARAMGRALALLLHAELETVRREIDALVAVPLHRTRLQERGYNQAQEIARVLARALEVPALEHGIERQVATPAQAGQGAKERRSGVARAFRIRRALAGRRIAIVDDVVTTGATVNALAAELKAAGATRCVVLAVARTPARAGMPEVEQRRERLPGAVAGSSCREQSPKPA